MKPPAWPAPSSTSPDALLREVDSVCRLLGVSRTEAIRRARRDYVQHSDSVKADGFGLWAAPSEAPAEVPAEAPAQGPARAPAHTATGPAPRRRRGSP